MNPFFCVIFIYIVRNDIILKIKHKEFGEDNNIPIMYIIIVKLNYFLCYEYNGKMITFCFELIQKSLFKFCMWHI